MSALLNARPGEVFVDSQGRLFKVTSYCETPTVRLEEICTAREHREDQEARRDRDVLEGGIYGCMWDGFRKIK